MATPRAARVFAVPPGEYRAFIAGLELETIYLESSTIKRHRQPTPGNGLHYGEWSGRATCEVTDRGFKASMSYSIRMLERGNDDPFATVACRFAAEYSSKTPVSDKLFEVFRELNLPLNLWPYMREHVHSSTVKMGFVPLILPTRKS